MRLINTTYAITAYGVSPELAKKFEQERTKRKETESKFLLSIIETYFQQNPNSEKQL